MLLVHKTVAIGMGHRKKNYGGKKTTVKKVIFGLSGKKTTVKWIKNYKSYAR